MDKLRPRRDPDSEELYIRCDCGAQRFIREAPMTECSKCGAWYEFHVEQVAGPIGE